MNRLKALLWFTAGWVIGKFLVGLVIPLWKSRKR